MDEGAAHHGEKGTTAVLRRALDLAVELPPLTPGHSNGDVIRYFRERPEAACLPVVEEDRPIGLINRGIFLSGFSQPFHREVYERKSCIAFMDKSPLTVDGEMPIEQLGRLAVEAGGKVLGDGFLVTRDGIYAGHGSGIDLLKALGQLEAERHRVVRESIEYAQIIQGSLMATSLGAFRNAGLADQHLLWEPRDTVGGDAFFARRCMAEGRDGLFVALMDCTGHGVPGAFTAMLMTSFLGNALDRVHPWEPGQVLAQVNRRVKAELGQSHRGDDLGAFEEGEARADEGMDVACLWIESGQMIFAGARNSLWVVAPGAIEAEELKADRMGVGYVGTPDEYEWSGHVLKAGVGTVLLAMSDGIVDQIGGPKRIAFGKRRFWEAFGSPERPLRECLEGVYGAMKAYQGAEERRDDVSLMALRLGGRHGA